MSVFRYNYSKNKAISDVYLDQLSVFNIIKTMQLRINYMCKYAID